MFFGCGRRSLAESDRARRRRTFRHSERDRLRHCRHGLWHRADLRLPRRSDDQFRRLCRGRMSIADMIGYSIAQVFSAIVAAVVSNSFCPARLRAGPGPWPERLGRGNFGEYNVVSALVFEVVGRSSSGLHSRRHPPDRADRLRRSRHRVDAGRHPSGRHQHHRHFGRSGALDRSGAGRHRFESRRSPQLWLFIIAPLIGAGAAACCFALEPCSTFRTSPEPRIPWLAGVSAFGISMAERGRGCALPRSAAA